MRIAALYHVETYQQLKTQEFWQYADETTTQYLIKGKKENVCCSSEDDIDGKETVTTWKNIISQESKDIFDSLLLCNSCLKGRLILNYLTRFSE